MLEADGAIFIGQSAENMIAELKKKPNGLILLAIRGGEVVGFKIGYEERTTRFYSWLGGVSPDHRGHGIASELMKQQHEWCCQQGEATLNFLQPSRLKGWESAKIPPSLRRTN